eukprot:TRINITY_DN1247_c0_g1_i1.p1 TRINITY_DN1247_c0_g1~~TRINITY_DN1247_c0_g1_i1.p1  ORF type:complete len:373 (-),score=86.92 TRINITY_DN1247_c0_g1_i1:18-1136(-)
MEQTSGFRNAPVSKAILLLTGIITILEAVFVSLKLFSLPSLVPYIFPSFQIWRLFTSNFCFTTMSEFFFGMMLLYTFRMFERQMGSGKFSVFFIFSIGISLMSKLAFSYFGYNQSSGPYGYIYAALVLFYAKVPEIGRVRITNSLIVSDKSYIYLLGLTLALANMFHCCVSVISGFLFGIIYVDYFYKKKEIIKIPKGIRLFCKTKILPYLISKPNVNQNRLLQQQLQQQLLQQNINNGGGNLLNMPQVNRNYYQHLNDHIMHNLHQYNQFVQNQNPNDNINNDNNNNNNNNNNEQNNNGISVEQLANNLRQIQGDLNENNNINDNNNSNNEVRPNGEYVDMLEGMGFSKEEAEFALTQTNNNLQLAINFLA